MSSLTPLQIQEARKAAGIPVQGFSSSTAPVNPQQGMTGAHLANFLQGKWAEQENAQVKADAEAKKNRSIGERVAEQYTGAGQKITESIKRGAEKFAAHGNQEGGIDTPQQTIQKTGDLLEAGLGSAAGMAQGVWTPVTATGEAIADKTDIHPVQTVMDALQKMFPGQSDKVNEWAAAHPDAARNLGDAVTVGLTAIADAGGVKNPLNADIAKTGKTVGDEIMTGAKQQVGEIKDLVGKTKEGAGNVVKTAQTSQELKPFEHAQRLTQPVLNKAEAEAAVKQGRVSEPGILTPSKVTPTARDNRVAESIADVVDSKKSTAENVGAIDQKISQSNLGVRDMIADRKQPFNKNQLRSRLESGKEDLDLIFASDANAERTYNAVVDRFMKHVESGDTLGLFDARQTFDQIPAIKKLLETEGLGENTRREIVLQVRRAANEYIAEQLPKNNPYRAFMLKEADMLEALSRIAENHSGDIGKNKIQLLMKKHPSLKWVAGGLGLATGTGVFNTVKDAITGSSGNSQY